MLHPKTRVIRLGSPLPAACLPCRTAAAAVAEAAAEDGADAACRSVIAAATTKAKAGIVIGAAALAAPGIAPDLPAPSKAAEAISNRMARRRATWATMPRAPNRRTAPSLAPVQCCTK